MLKARTQAKTKELLPKSLGQAELLWVAELLSAGSWGGHGGATKPRAL